MSNPAELDAHVRQLIQDKNVLEATAACDQLNQRFPEYEKGWYTASYLAMLIDEPVIAVRAIDQALRLSPGKPEWLFQRLECLIATGDIKAAKETALQLIKHKFSDAGLASRFASSLTSLGMYRGARSHYARATELEPLDGQHHYNLATIERFLGNVDRALAAVNRCLDLSPDDEDAHFLRAGLKTKTADINNVEAMEAALERATANPRRRIRLCYALSKELEDLGEFDRSFDYLSQGSSLRRAGFQYTLQNDLDSMRRVRETYTPEMFDGHIPGHVNAEPIFVIGMPRTGTTLVDRILGSHSVVRSAGELQTFSVELVKNCQKTGGKQPGTAADLASLSATIDFEALGEDYIAGTRTETGNSVHFVDKLPLNFLYAGLIHLALPKAKIVLLDRDPMDTCYAAYKTLFEGIYPFSYDLTELATYFNAYRELVAHWQSVMPGVLHVVKYEELVTDPKPVVENLLSYCGLSYEDACLTYYKSEQASTTASAVQVRQNFFRSSLGKWRNYEQRLQSVADIVAKHL